MGLIRRRIARTHACSSAAQHPARGDDEATLGRPVRKKKGGGASPFSLLLWGTDGERKGDKKRLKKKKRKSQRLKLALDTCACWWHWRARALRVADDRWSVEELCHSVSEFRCL